MGVVFPKPFLVCLGSSAVSVAVDGEGLLAVHIVEAELNVLLPHHFAVKLEEGVVIVDSFLSRAGPVAIGKTHVDDLVGIIWGDLTRNTRAEDNVDAAGVVRSAVDVVRYSQHQISSNEESRSSLAFFEAEAEHEVSDAVMRVFPRFGGTHLFGDIAEITLIVVILLINIHLNFIEK
jgi:hypothetical protein